jgi:hypothetical protein
VGHAQTKIPQLSREARSAARPERWRLAGWPGARPAAALTRMSRHYRAGGETREGNDPQMTQMYADKTA